MFFSHRKNPFTLLEVLLVLSLVALFAGVIGWNIQGALMRQRFLTETSLVVDRLRLAQDMMLLLDADVSVKFRAEKSQMTIFLETDAKLSKEWQDAVAASKLFLREIHSISFVDQNQQTRDKGQLQLQFYSNGSVMSQGELVLSSHENYKSAGAITRSICLYGSPQAIVSVPKPTTGDVCKLPQKQVSDDNLTTDTQRQVLGI